MTIDKNLAPKPDVLTEVWGAAHYYGGRLWPDYNPGGHNITVKIPMRNGEPDKTRPITGEWIETKKTVMLLS